ncbi:PPOX class F420-dependent oxidoreductase [Thermomonospora cellulosilytica]|uniref:Pyridoxamine 5'-phosphate oxidase family protein n=1 Tax=Thermomonospora cellulosilytica TaxID=1411118 RepID=A0A7W3MZR5_9ACTN|nr:PPOX class F420-dependent oxidoreductase [Thermomonospora cellulosilytica]MBA9004822.1 pyridoxamine 5'-phosphate oxidase family protein [Thermomonospora cellulosilytica]
MVFTEAERAYLTEQPLGRLATLGPTGWPQVKPVAFWTRADVIEIGGPGLSGGRMYRNVRADPRISFVVDDMADHPVGPGGQTGRGIEIRGRGELLTVERPLLEGFTKDVLRIHPRRIVAWNIDGPGPNIRDVT